MKKSLMFLALIVIGAVTLSTVVRKAVEFCSHVEIQALTQQSK